MTALDRMVSTLVGRQGRVEATAEMVVATVAAPAVAVVGSGSSLMRLNRGFTLVEVVISLGILLLIGALSWSTIAGTLKLRQP